MTVTLMEDDKPDVTIVFDGVVAVGPGRPAEGDTQDGPFFAVLARSTRRLSNRTGRLQRRRQQAAAIAAASGKVPEEEPEEEPFYVHMHVPTVYTRMKPAAGSRPPDQVLQLSLFHEPWYLWHPFRERLEFRIDDDAAPGPLHYPKADPPVKHSSRGHYLTEQELSFHPIDAVPDLSNIWPERSVLRAGMLSSDPDVDQRVMTQVFVPRGTVVAAGVLEQGKPRRVVFEPSRRPDEARTGPVEQDAVPSTAVIVQGSSVEIVSYSLDSGDQLDSILLDASDGGEIWVSNGDPSDVEFDMQKLSIEILKRIIADPKWTSPVTFRDFIPVLGPFGDALDRMLPEGLETALARMFVTFHHHHHPLPTVTRPSTGNLDLDFELLYTLMKGERIAMDDEGLPVPRRVDVDAEQGPDCYNCTCRTTDALELKSTYGAIPAERRQSAPPTAP